MEEQRKEEAKQAVAAVEVAETAAVLEAVEQLFSNSNSSAESPPGVLGQVVMKTETGPVKVAAFSAEALANAAEPAKVSAGKDSTAEVEVDAGLLGEVAAAAGSDQVLLSLAELDGKASAIFRTDNVLAQDGRRLASALRSRPLSINFRKTDGQKIEVNNLVQPMKMSLTVDDSDATCAFWDEELAVWSTEGVETLPGSEPGNLLCSSTHLSIFGGVVKVILKNIVLALECSTFSSLMNEAGFQRLSRTEWLGRPASLVSFSILAVFAFALSGAALADRRASETIPWVATENMLMRVKEKEKPKEEADGQTGAGATEDEQTKQEMSKKESAAGGDWELPSIFRMFRGMVESLLDMLSQATGGANFVDEIKEVIASADTGTLNRSIGMIQSHRSGACQATIRVVQTGAEDVRRGESTHEDHVRTGRLTIRASIRAGMEAVGRMQRRAAAKVSVLAGNVQQNGSGAAESFLSRGFFCRIGMLLPAVHNWLKVRQISVMVPYSVRVALIGMKVMSAEALTAFFFSSKAPEPGSNPDCSPPPESLARLVQAVTVGFATAFFGDGIIFLLFFVQRKKVISKTEWTEKQKDRQRMWWRIRTISFWVITFCYTSFCQIYTWLFLANVREVDASQWLDSMFLTLFQDLILKPVLLAVILATMCTVILCWRPSLKRKIQERWNEVPEKNPAQAEEQISPPRSPMISCASSEAGDAVLEVEEKEESKTDGSFTAVLPGMPA
eukprot:s2534_g8.t1